MRLLWQVVALVTTLPLVAPVLSNTRSDVSNAIVMIAVRGKASNGGNISRTGTGFIVGNSRYIITSNHVVEPPPTGWSKRDFDFDDMTIAIRFRDPQTGLMTESRRAHIHRSNPGKDIALLEFDGLPRKGLSTCPATEVQADLTQVIVAGVFYSDPTDVPKLELNIGVLNEALSQDNGRRRVSAKTREGFSGGPVLFAEQQDLLRPIGVLKGGQSFGSSSQSLFTPLSETRGLVLAYCTVACRDESHGVERYERDDVGALHTSDWQRGGSSSATYCGAYRSAEMNRNPGVAVTIESHADNDFRFFTGMRDGMAIVREAQYKYSCQLRYQSGPTYKLALSPKCPAPINPDNLPN